MTKRNFKETKNRNQKIEPWISWIKIIRNPNGSKWIQLMQFSSREKSIVEPLNQLLLSVRILAPLSLSLSLCVSLSLSLSLFFLLLRYALSVFGRNDVKCTEHVKRQHWQGLTSRGVQLSSVQHPLSSLYTLGFLTMNSEHSQQLG